jgi:Zinc carboxypeptidase
MPISTHLTHLTNLFPAALLLACMSISTAAPLTALSTHAERSQFSQTGRYEEVIRLCHAFQKTWPKAVRCMEFGKTPEGRPMLALIASQSGALTPAAAQRAKLPVVLVQGGIHAGEIDGKDAGFLALRELLQQSGPKAILRQQVLIFVPVFNVDGHERFGAWNRPNQRGPEQMGWRTTGQNLNLNRDYAKADAPEMQAMLGLINQWDPLVYVDLHVTNGAKFEHDISIQLEPTRSGEPGLRAAGLQLRDKVIQTLEQSGSLPRPFYFSFDQEDEPTSGFTDNVARARFSHGYPLLRNRFGMLVETHSWKDYPTRVRITKNTILATTQQVAQHGRAWLAAAHEADSKSSALASQPVALTWRATDAARPIEFYGYAWQQTQSEISGSKMITYDESKPKRITVPLRDQIVPDLVLKAPAGGYLIAPAQANQMAAKLQQHGIAFRRLGNALPRQMLEVFRAEKVSFAAQPYEGRQRLNQSGEWKPEARSVDAGALFVPIAQAKARLIMTLLEPMSPDSLSAWGFFNPMYEQKEYMEAYVAEEVARAQLAQDPELAKAFQQKLASDSKFAQSPQARLEFFARRHPSWDERYQLYPVFRLGKTP